MFQMCFKEVSRKFQSDLKKFHVAWHLLQLPKRTEGLLKEVYVLGWVNFAFVLCKQLFVFIFQMIIVSPAIFV